MKEGLWILDDYDMGTWKCSECNNLWIFPKGTPYDNEANYCPRCGAHLISDAFRKCE